MSKRNIILLVVALLVAGATAMALKSRVQPTQAQKVEAAAPTTQRVLVAKQNIATGSFVKTGTDLDWAEWPVAALQTYHIKQGTEELTSYEGSIVRRALKAGEAITPGALIKPGAGGFLSAVLEPGRRAISIAVSATSGTAGFIFPGDRVDLILTHRVSVKTPGNEGSSEASVSETFVRNVRVVAVDQMLDNPQNKAILAKTVTLEVTPAQAEQVALAEDMGKISLALRSLATDTAAQADEAEPVELTRALGAASVENEALSVAPMNNPRVLVIRGGESEQREFYQGSR